MRFLLDTRQSAALLGVLQIHGHDFSCLAMLPGCSPPCYASGSEEKVTRVLEAPQAFEETLSLARGDFYAASTSGHQVII